MKLNVNGAEHEIESPPLSSLLSVLREELGITSPKAGCQQGGCGACTVLVDGGARRACLLPVAAVDGAKITTVEGLGAPESLSPLQAAFYEHYAAQCGFCTSGMMLAAQSLLARTPEPSRQEIELVLGGHICRCTGYVKIVEAVEAAGGGGR
jgi:aerobic-type carbon monoxide dehydrogenase small subunit (CoxS/CutS family)